MKKIIIFCLLIISCLFAKAKDWKEFFDDCIQAELYSYNNKIVDTIEFAKNLEQMEYEKCKKTLDELENKIISQDKKVDIAILYYLKSFVLAHLNDTNAVDYFHMANDIKLSYDLALFWDKDYFRDINEYFSNQDLTRLESNLIEDKVFYLFKYKANKVEESLNQLQEIYSKKNRKIALMRIEFLRLMKNFNLKDNQLAQDNAKNILKISKDNNINNFYSIIAQKTLEKDFVSKYKKQPLLGIIIIITVVLGAIISAVYFGNKFKDK